jgi:hypothetical protein
VFHHNALAPTAVLDVPLLFEYKAVNPKAALEVPVVLYLIAASPTAVFWLAALLNKAPDPTATF